MVRAMVHSNKHFVPFAIDQIATGTVQNVILVAGVSLAATDASNEVTEGNTVKAIYVELWLQNQGNLGEFIMILEKVQESSAGATFTEMANLFAYTNKKNVLYTTQGLTSNDGVSGPVNIIKGWVKIPKGKQRFGFGDRFIMSIANVSAGDLNRCGISIFKEYK